MKPWTTSTIILAILWSTAVLAGPSPRVHVTEKTRLQAAAEHVQSNLSKHGGRQAARDSILYMGPWGSGAPFNGQFQDQSGNPAWNGWTHEDGTQTTQLHWQAWMIPVSCS